MLAAQRQSLIVDEVNRLGAVRIADLAAALRVSDMTVRRDLAALAGAGLVVKVHGGVTAIEPTSAAGWAENRPAGRSPPSARPRMPSPPRRSGSSSREPPSVCPAAARHSPSPAC